MFTVENQFELAAKSLQALGRIQNNRQRIEEEKLDPAKIKPNYTKVFFEEFDEESFNQKVKLDSGYYNMLLSKLEESDLESVQGLLGNMLGTVRQIYEHINIKGKVYGMSRLATLDDTDDMIQESAGRIVNDFIGRNYYSLTREERHSKYMNEVKAVATSSVIQEGVEPEVAVQQAIKTAVFIKLIESINFPLTVKSEIEHCLVSEEYSQIFKQDELNSLWDLFNEQCQEFAKIVSVIV